ncbi:N-acetylglucosamine-binding protein GbpA [Burkholderia sp. FERM BP-3421]|jgi:chitin-binding protein|uniref:N-acetylglucosamine-binding protein GbpA n=1 Tax=Burkholderia sp. FERM BP-3421 TaxID=1494466 RepID=UPI00236033DF|nr:N-acetylglucosamine-binding protein GbpA [Burkholderia sp. FERM BP-3421]WDD92725.1 N-acetylglucosamine-binding protein GbpA [Burkholderia sp. FERM BP-3421]
MFFAQHAFAHGYLSDPPSRNLLCSSKAGSPQNANCGSVTYEPQSVEGKQGFPQAGAPDGQIPSGGVVQFSELNEQNAVRWKILDLKPGRHDFKWTFTAPHVTKEFKYYITKQGWNPNALLTREQFDLTPFCTIDGGMKKANEIGPHGCTIPSDRTGHHVILSTWHVGDTAGMFYNVADVNITKDGGGTDPGKPGWKDVGDIMPSQHDLGVGDKVHNRVFGASGEIAGMKTSMTISSAQNGEKNMWPMLLAKEINRTQSAKLMAGVKNGGAIEPVPGMNDVYAKDGSGVTRTETTVEKKPEGGIDEGFSISNNNEFKIENGKATAKFFLKFNHAKETDVGLKVFDGSQKMVGSTSAKMKSQGDLSVDIANAKAGPHTVVATSQIQGGKLVQESSTFKLVGDSGGGEGAQCASAWAQAAAYTGGAKVQHQGRTYEARWWTQGEIPGLPATTGADYTGKVWKDLGACAK